MEELTIPFELLLRPHNESLEKRDKFMSEMEKDVKIIRMDSDGIIAEITTIK